MIGALLTFNSCSSDDDPKPEPIDYTLHDKSEILEIKSGKVEVKLSLGNYDPYPSSAEVRFVASDNKDILNLFINSPAEIGGPIQTSNFKKSEDDKQYIFAIANYSPSEKTGNEIPTYIANWYKDYELSKVIIKDLKCSDAIYDKATKEMSFTYTGSLELYTISDKGEERFANNTITYIFTELIK